MPGGCDGHMMFWFIVRNSVFSFRRHCGNVYFSTLHLGSLPLHLLFNCSGARSTSRQKWHFSSAPATFSTSANTTFGPSLSCSGALCGFQPRQVLLCASRLREALSGQLAS